MNSARTRKVKKRFVTRPCVDCGTDIRTQQDRKIRCGTCVAARSTGVIALKARVLGCIDCGDTFTPGNPNQTLCDGCRHIPGEKLECGWCKGEFTASPHKPRGARKYKYCGASCSGKASGMQRAVRAFSGAVCPIRMVYCGCCGKLRGIDRRHKGLVCDSSECRSEHTRAQNWCRMNGVDMSLRTYLRAKAPRQCGCCGEVYTPTQASKLNTCPPCVITRGRQLDKARKRVKTGEVHPMLDAIHSLTVFRRDGWKCYICGDTTPRHLVGTLDLKAPQVEHITAFANGGLHEWNNVACACRKCNMDKSAGVLISMMNGREIKSRDDLMHGHKYMVRHERIDRSVWPDDVRHGDTYSHLAEIGW